MKIKLLFATFLVFSFCFLFSANYSSNVSYYPPSNEVALAGNAFITYSPAGAPEVITSNGLGNWVNPNTIISTYLKVSNAGTLTLSLKARVPSGSSTAKITVNGVSQTITMTGSAYMEYPVGDFTVSTPGYVKIDLQGVTKTGGYFGDASHFIFSGSATTGTNIFSNDTSYYYWARRGPSCHLGYVIPTTNNVSYYYNEVTVPVGEDKVSSYFMANGFQQGYFGIQVNSSTERRVLFSVWSPFPTDDPNNIPEDHKITLNCKGTNVIKGQFGNEGSGGQSYLQCNWQAGVTYKFLVKGEPDGTGKTDYTAWFFAPESGTWKMIASWKRPYTDTYLKGFYSFVENFTPNSGYMGRRAEYGNQWIKTQQGQWMPINQAKFTADATYTANQRIDAYGGTINNKFYLKNGGFFNETIPLNTIFTIATPTQSPDINPADLPGCQTLSVSDVENPNTIQISPNPATNFIKVSGLKDNTYKYKIFGTDGRMIMNGEANGSEISLGQLIKGNYILCLFSKNNEMKGNFKFTKN